MSGSGRGDWSENECHYTSRLSGRANGPVARRHDHVSGTRPPPRASPAASAASFKAHSRSKIPAFSWYAPQSPLAPPSISIRAGSRRTRAPMLRSPRGAAGPSPGGARPRRRTRRCRLRRRRAAGRASSTRRSRPSTDRCRRSRAPSGRPGCSPCPGVSAMCINGPSGSTSSVHCARRLSRWR